METLTMLTNLVPTRGWTHSPCLAPGLEQMVRKGTTHVLIDHEADNWLIENGSKWAIDKAKKVIADFRLATDAKLGWYGWPYPQKPSHVEPFAEAFGPLVQLADWLAPSLYSNGLSNAPDRAALFVKCVAEAGIVGKPVIPCLSDVRWDGIPCTDAEVSEQIEAARIAGAQTIYLWSGMAFRAWAAKFNVGPTHPAYWNVNKARAELLGTWGWSIAEWTPQAIAAAYKTESRRILDRFWAAWKAEA